MTQPRQIEAGRTFFISVRAVNRSFRFVPHEMVRKSLDYALKAVAAKFEDKIALHEYEFLSNHYHLLGTDLTGCLPDFMRDLNAIISRQLNALRGVRGTNIEKDYNLCIVNMKTGAKAIDHAVYILANAVASHLVERTSEWKAPSSWSLEYGEEVEAHRPECGLWSGKVDHAKRAASRRSKRARYAGTTAFPLVVRFKLVRPKILQKLSPAQLRAVVRGKVVELEDALIAKRRHQGRRVAGWAHVVSKRYYEIPSKTEEFFAVRPTFSSEDEQGRSLAKRLRCAFVAAYRGARSELVSRLAAGRRSIRGIVFPLGTWLMRRRYNVECATCSPALAP